MDQQEKLRRVTEVLRKHVDALLAAVQQANSIFPRPASDYVPESPVANAWHNAFHRAAAENNIPERTAALETRLLAIQQSIAEDIDPDCAVFVQAWLGVMEIGDEFADLARWSEDTRRKIAQAVAQLN